MNYWQTFISFTQETYFAPLLSLVNAILLFLTALLTFFSFRTSKRANELQLLPLLAIYFEGKTFKDRKIVIQNIGKSPAYDIMIESFTNLVTDIQRIWKLDLFIKGTNVLTPGQTVTFVHRATVNGEVADIQDFLVLYLDPEENHVRNSIELIITFKNAEGNKYFSKIITGKNGLFVKPSKRIGIIENVYLFFRRFQEEITLKLYKFKWKFRKPYFSKRK